MTHFDMFSQAKHIDKMLLLELGELVEALLTHVHQEGVLEQIDFYTKQYAELEHRINTFDYTRTDELLETL